MRSSPASSASRSDNSSVFLASQLITHGIDIDACATERPHRDAVDAVENAEQKMFRSHIFAERLRMALGSKHHFTGV